MRSKIVAKYLNFLDYLLFLQAIVIEITLIKNNSSFIIYRKEDLIY